MTGNIQYPAQQNLHQQQTVFPSNSVDVCKSQQVLIHHVYAEADVLYFPKLPQQKHLIGLFINQHKYRNWSTSSLWDRRHGLMELELYDTRAEKY